MHDVIVIGCGPGGYASAIRASQLGGKVAVIDAIEALCAVSDPEDIWRELVAAHPEIVALCERYSFGDAPPAIVVDAPGWAVIEALLPDYVPCEA